MMVVIVSNADEVVNELAAIPASFQTYAMDGFLEGSKSIVSMFQREQLSGRKADDAGLNIKSRRLYQSLESSAMVVGDTVVGSVGNRGATYWEYHQRGTERLRKRLFLEEDFQTKGADIYLSLADAAFEKVAA